MSEPTVRARHPRRRLAAFAAVLVAASGLAAGCGSGSDSGQVGDAASPENAVEFMGRLDQDGVKISGYGYVSHVSGLEDKALFTSGDALRDLLEGGSEKNARLTFSFQTKLTTRAVHQPIFAVGSEGTIDFYVNDRPAGNFGKPASFAKGKKVASGSLTVQNIIDVYAPNKGIATGEGALELNSASSFEIDGESHQLGEDGLKWRVSLTGQGTRSNATLPKATIDFAGNFTVAGD